MSYFLSVDLLARYKYLPNRTQRLGERAKHYDLSTTITGDLGLVNLIEGFVEWDLRSIQLAMIACSIYMGLCSCKPTSLPLSSKTLGCLNTRMALWKQPLFVPIHALTSIKVLVLVLVVLQVLVRTHGCDGSSHQQNARILFFSGTTGTVSWHTRLAVVQVSSKLNKIWRHLIDCRPTTAGDCTTLTPRYETGPRPQDVSVDRFHLAPPAIWEVNLQPL